MKKIVLKFENQHSGKTDIVKKELDLDYQAGNTEASDKIQEYNIKNSFCLALYDFAYQIGIPNDDFKNHLDLAYNISVDIDDEPEADFPLDVAIDNSKDLESFTKQFNESAQFRQMVFDIFQDSMEED